MFWWDSEDEHPIRSADEAQHWFAHIHRLYQRLDQAIGDVVDRYGNSATIIVMSDHGFANFGMQFNLNSWLRDFEYLGPRECTSIMKDVDWSQTAAYGLGINGLYVNLKGRERDGTVEPGEQKEALLQQIVAQLKAFTDAEGRPVISEVYRADQEYSGQATALAPDLIVGYARGFRASWETCLGEVHEEILRPNDNAWSADHCADARHVPGLLVSNRPITVIDPSLIDLAPSILVEYGLDVPASMEGRNIFSS
jgi:predicted AlkP superfamily phosphohydrolase/phosphomutase